jgi:hypothetical protein
VLVGLSVGAGGGWCCGLDLLILVPVSGIAVALGVFFRQLWEGAWPFGRLAVWQPQSTVTDKSATVTDKSAIVTVAVG